MFHYFSSSTTKAQISDPAAKYARVTRSDVQSLGSIPSAGAPQEKAAGVAAFFASLSRPRTAHDSTIACAAESANGGLRTLPSTSSRPCSQTSTTSSSASITASKSHSAHRPRTTSLPSQSANLVPLWDPLTRERRFIQRSRVLAVCERDGSVVISADPADLNQVMEETRDADSHSRTSTDLDSSQSFLPLVIHYNTDSVLRAHCKCGHRLPDPPRLHDSSVVPEEDSEQSYIGSRRASQSSTSSASSSASSSKESDFTTPPPTKNPYLLSALTIPPNTQFADFVRIYFPSFYLAMDLDVEDTLPSSPSSTYTIQFPHTSPCPLAHPPPPPPKAQSLQVALDLSKAAHIYPDVSHPGHGNLIVEFGLCAQTCRLFQDLSYDLSTKSLNDDVSRISLRIQSAIPLSDLCVQIDPAGWEDVNLL